MYNERCCCLQLNTYFPSPSRLLPNVLSGVPPTDTPRVEAISGDWYRDVNTVLLEKNIYYVMNDTMWRKD